MLIKEKYVILSLYRFINIKNIFREKNLLKRKLKNCDAKGTVILAPEGINLSLSFLSKHKKPLIEMLKSFNISKMEDNNLLYDQKHAFNKLKIKIKREILTTRHSKKNINPIEVVGNYVKPEDWDEFINQSDTILIDTRNNFEVELGTFKKAINPKAKNFTEILNWLENSLLKKNKKNKKKIAMFCTGGIRCEKATSLIKKKGYKDVYHLKGGIINYLKNNKYSNTWKGECFVFDNRVSLDVNLKKGSYRICFACRMPIKNDEKSFKNELGISCKFCYGTKTSDQLRRYAMRNYQLKLSNKKALS